MNNEPRNTNKRNLVITISISLFLLLALVAVLWPIFARARRSNSPGPQSYCLSNLKQIGLGINMYIADWDNKLPPVSGFGPELDKHKALWGARGDVFNQRGAKHKYLFELLQPYVKNTKMFICPVVGENAVWKVPDGEVNLRNNSYIFNAWCVTDSTKTPPAGCMQIAGQSASICKSPADAPLAWDAVSGYAPSKGKPAQFAHVNTKYYILHEYSINALYADWHVKSMSMNANKPPYNATSGRQGHFWGAPDPNKPNGTLGAVK